MVKKDLSNYLSQFSQLSVRLVAIGGTALVLRGIKTATLDLDFVVQNEEDYRKLLDYSANLGYMAKAYEEGWTRLKGPVVIEIFLKQVQGVRISERMISRCSKDLLKFGKFEILPLHPQDVFILKAVAGREPKDLEDMKTIVEKKCINWEQLVEEIKMLLEEGASTRVVLSTGYWLEKLKNTEKLEIPDQLLDKLWNLLP
ncbi:MAG: nucleotidyltransferase [Candidatus Jordarchaeaceae archaeon]